MRANRIGKWLTAFGILAICIVVGAVSIAAQPSSPTPTPVSQSVATPQASPAATALSGADQQALLKEAVQVTGDKYPKVVAYVDGNPISGKNLAQQIYVIQHNPQDVAFRADAVNVALNWLIQNQVLLEHAGDYGISVSDDDARGYIEQVKAQTAQDPNSQELTKELAKQLGVDPADYFEQPEVIKQYRDGLTLAAVQRYVLATIPADKRSGDWQSQALADFVDSLNPKVQILIAH
ncbi:MAG: SurA N-terminal domain-containing protein [Nitrolancea sp.]